MKLPETQEDSSTVGQRGRGGRGTRPTVPTLQAALRLRETTEGMRPDSKHGLRKCSLLSPQV